MVSRPGGTQVEPTFWEFNEGAIAFRQLAPIADSQALEEMASRVEAHLALPTEEKEAQAEELFRDLAVFVADAF